MEEVEEGVREEEDPIVLCLDLRLVCFLFVRICFISFFSTSIFHAD